MPELLTPSGNSIPVCDIATIIEADWAPVNYAAKPYLDAMHSLRSPKDNYIADSGVSVILYFLSNASAWRGETARAVKVHLKKLVDGKITVE